MISYLLYHLSNDAPRVKGSQNWLHFAHRLKCTVTLNSNFASYLKNLKLFSIRMKELIEPIVLRRICDGFLLFLKAFFEKPIFE